MQGAGGLFAEKTWVFPIFCSENTCLFQTLGNPAPADVMSPR